MRPRGEVIGRAAHGLREGHNSWAANQEVAAVGARGEQETAHILNTIAFQVGGPTVLHDVAIPIPGFSANIDHIIVSGNFVTIIDTKVWRPDFYWTLMGKTRRGWQRFTPAERRTMAMAYDRIRAYLSERNTGAIVVTPQLWVWPSSPRKKMSLWALRVPGARVILGDRAARAATSKKYRGASPRVVAALAPLVSSVRSDTSR